MGECSGAARATDSEIGAANVCASRWRVVKARSMNITKLLTAGAFAFALLGTPAFAADTHAACCEKAKAAGKECDHKCCVDAKAAGKDCAKCSKPKDPAK